MFKTLLKLDLVLLFSGQNHTDMKKIVTAVAALMLMGSVSFAQATKPAAKAETKTTKTTKTTETKHVKKDGTPDMRYKENKTAKTTTKVKTAAGTTKTTTKTATKATK